MSGPPPPFGHPWLVNVGNNPNINHDPPPPPLEPGAPQGVNAIPIHIIAGAPPQAGAPIGIVVNGAAPAPGAPQPPPNNMPLPMGPPPPYAPMPAYGMAGGIMPGMMGMGMGMPGMMGMGMPGMMGMGMGMTPQGFPPAPNPGCGVSPLAAGGMGFGYGGIPPPFAAGGMPWAGGMGMGMTGGGFMGGFAPGFHRPPLPFIEGDGGGVGPKPEAQEDPTVKPGGDLPGHTVVQPAETTSIFRILNDVLPWEHQGMTLQVEPMQFDSGWTINRVIAAMRKPNTECQGWGLTVCIELGGGRWAKGMTYVHGSQPATECSLGMVGMGSANNRDGTREKLYVLCHRI